MAPTQSEFPDLRVQYRNPEFVGGRVSPIGAVFGALTLMLAQSFLTFLSVPSDWQIGAQGMILIVILALRLTLSRMETAR